MEVFNAFLSTVITIGIIFYGVGQFRAGRFKKETETVSNANATIQLLNNRVDVMQKELDEGKSLHIKNREEIIRLQEQAKHKDAEIKRLLDILRDRNPETEQFMRLVTDAALQSQEYMKTTSAMLVQIEKWMSAIDKKTNLSPIQNVST